MFSYILSCGDSIPIEVLSVRSQKDSSHLPDNRLLKELMKRHGLSAEYIVLKGKPEEEIIAYVKHLKEHALICLGAYQRGMVSRWYRQSMADLLMKEINCPLFIAHYKV